MSFLSLRRGAPPCGRRAAAALLAGPHCIDRETPGARELQPISATGPRWRHMQCPWQTRRALHSRHAVASKSPSQPTGATHAERVWRPPLPSTLNDLQVAETRCESCAATPRGPQLIPRAQPHCSRKAVKTLRGSAPTDPTAKARSHECAISAAVTVTPNDTPRLRASSAIDPSQQRVTLSLAFQK